MRLEDQYCTREQAIKLRARGVEAAFDYGCYYTVISKEGREMGFVQYATNGELPFHELFQPVRHFSLAEVMAMLQGFESRFDPGKKCWYFRSKEGRYGSIQRDYATLVEAEAARLMFDLRHGRVSSREANERLNFFSSPKTKVS